MLSRNHKRTALYALRGLLLYVAFALTLQLTSTLLYINGLRLPGTGIYSSAAISESLKLPLNFAHLLLILVIPFLYYSIARAFLLGDAYGYAATEELDGTKGKISLRQVVTSPVYLIMLATSVLGFAVLPLSFGFGELQAWAGFAAVMPFLYERPLLADKTATVFWGMEIAMPVGMRRRSPAASVMGSSMAAQRSTAAAPSVA